MFVPDMFFQLKLKLKTNIHVAFANTSWGFSAKIILTFFHTGL